MGDVPLELLIAGLAQDRLLIGFGQPGEHRDVARVLILAWV
jgi:hypothetical protein